MTPEQLMRTNPKDLTNGQSFRMEDEKGTPLTLDREVGFRVSPGTLNSKKRTVKAILSKGARVLRFSFWDGPWYEELGMDPENIRMGRLQNKAPFLDQHNHRVGVHGESKGQIGVIEGADIVDESIEADIKFSQRESVKEIFQDVEDGILAKISVGYTAFSSEKIGEDNGIPIFRITDWEPFEGSLVSAGADDDAMLRSKKEKELLDEYRNQNSNNDKNPNLVNNNINNRSIEKNKKENIMTEEEKRLLEEANQRKLDAQKQDHERKMAEEKEKNEAEAEKLKAEVLKDERERSKNIETIVETAKLDSDFSRKLIEEGVDLNVARERVLAKMAERDQDAPTHSPRIDVGKDLSKEHRNLGMQNALLVRGLPGKYEVDDHGKDFRHMSVCDMARECLEANGVSTRGMAEGDIATRALSSSDFSELLANTAGKTLRDAYAEADQTHMAITNVVEHRDFKQISRTQAGDFPELKEVPEHGNVEEGKHSDAAEKYNIKTFARKLKYTRKTVINDDLDFLVRMPNSAGRRARQLEADKVWNEIVSNPVMHDGKTLFHADHGNLGTPAVISVVSVGEGRALMRKQKGLDGERIQPSPAFLATPTSLETVAEQFVRVAILATKDADANPFKGRLQDFSEVRLDDDSLISWYLFANKGDIPIIEMAKLTGFPEPSLVTKNLGGVEGIEIEIFYDFGVKAIDWRGTVKNAGA